MELIDKAEVLAEIEKRKKRNILSEGRYEEDIELYSLISSLEVKEVDLEKEIQRQYNIHKNSNNIAKNCVIMTKGGFEYFAKYFFELGLKVQKGE